MFQDYGLDEFSAALAATGVRSELLYGCIHIRLLKDQGVVDVKPSAGGECSVQFLREEIPSMSARCVPRSYQKTSVAKGQSGTNRSCPCMPAR